MYLNTAKLLVTGLFIFQALMLINSDLLFNMLNQPSEAVTIAQVYIISVLPGTFLGMQFECMRRYLLTLGMYTPILYTLLVSTAVHLVLLYLFLFVFELKILGVALVSGITYSLKYGVLSYYMYRNSEIFKSDKWFFLDQEAYSKISEFAKYGVPAALMLMTEWWAYELINIYAGWIGVDELAAYIIMFNIFCLFFMNSLGITYSTNGLVGTCIGSNQPNKARRYSQIALVFGVFCTTLILFFYFVFRHTVIGFYTSDQKVVDIILDSFSFYILVMFVDMMQGVTGGIIRAMGYQKFATVCQFVAIWMIMLPMSYFC